MFYSRDSLKLFRAEDFQDWPMALGSKPWVSGLWGLEPWPLVFFLLQLCSVQFINDNTPHQMHEGQEPNEDSEPNVSQGQAGGLVVMEMAL